MASEDPGRFHATAETHKVAPHSLMLPAASAPRVDKAASGPPRQQDVILQAANTVNQEIILLR